MKLEIGFPIMENWIIIRSGLCSEGKQIDIFFCLLLFKVWWSLGSVLRTTPSLSCAKKILEHDFNTSVYTHSHGSLMFFVRPYCLKMTWVELKRGLYVHVPSLMQVRSEKSTFLWHQAAFISIITNVNYLKMAFLIYGIYWVTWKLLIIGMP